MKDTCGSSPLNQTQEKWIVPGATTGTSPLSPRGNKHNYWARFPSPPSSPTFALCLIRRRSHQGRPRHSHHLNSSAAITSLAPNFCLDPYLLAAFRKYHRRDVNRNEKADAEIIIGLYQMLNVAPPPPPNNPEFPPTVKPYSVAVLSKVAHYTN